MAISSTTLNDFCPSASEPAPSGQDRRQMLDCVPGSIAHLGWRPILLTGLFVQLLREHFANADNIEDPDLKDPAFPAIWRDTLRTGILIESVHRWRGDLVEKRPAVLVKRNAFKNEKLTINDLAGTNVQGFDHYVTLWVGSHTLFCISGTGASCEILATEVQRELTQFGPAIRQQFGLHKFQVVEVGAIGELEESTQNFAVPVTIGWAYQETWTLEQEALPLKAVDFEALISVA